MTSSISDNNENLSSPRNWLTKQQLDSILKNNENYSQKSLLQTLEESTQSQPPKILQIELPEKYAWVFLGVLIVILLYFICKGVNNLNKKYKIWQENRIRNRFVKNVTNTEFMSSPTISMVGSKCSNCGCGKQASTRPALSSVPRNISSQHGLSLPKVQSVHSGRTVSTSCKPQTLPFKMDSHIGLSSPRTEVSKIQFNFSNRATKKMDSDNNHSNNNKSGNSIQILEQMSAEPSKQPDRPRIDFHHQPINHNQISCPPNLGHHDNFHPATISVQSAGIPNFGIGGNNDHMGKFDISQITALQKNFQASIDHPNLYQIHSVPPMIEQNQNQHHNQNRNHQVRNHQNQHENKDQSCHNTSNNNNKKNNTNQNVTDSPQLTLGKRSVASIETRNSYIIKKFLLSNKGRILDTAAQLVGPNGTLKSKLSKIDMNDLAAQAKLEALISGSTRSNSSEF